MFRHPVVPMVILLPTLSWAQGAPGTNLTVDVRVAGVQLRGDTSRIEFVIRNHPESAEPLFEFRVEAPAPVVRIEQPAPAENWATFTSYKGLSMASWALLSTQLLAGEESPVLAFEARGLPAIVTFYATGWFPVPPEPPCTPGPPPPPPMPRDALVANSVAGKTVGVEPFPPDVSASSLLTRLRSEESCNLAWITDTGVCHSLDVKLNQAGASLGGGDAESARGELSAFLAELTAQHGSEPGKHVTDNAYWLLRPNAEFLRLRL